VKKIESRILSAKNKPTMPNASSPISLRDKIIELIRANDAAGIRRFIADPTTPASVWRGLGRVVGERTPLMNYAVSGRVEALSALMAVCDPEQASSGGGNTPLMLAAGHGDPRAVGLLLPVSKPNRKNSAGQTALDQAIGGLVLQNAICADWTPFLRCVSLLAPVSDMGMPGPGIGSQTHVDKLLNCLSVSMQTEGLWACVDTLAPFCDRSWMVKIMKKAPAGAMPRFCAQIEREELSGMVKDAAPQSAIDPQESRGRKKTRSL